MSASPHTRPGRVRIAAGYESRTDIRHGIVLFTELLTAAGPLPKPGAASWSSLLDPLRNLEVLGEGSLARVYEYKGLAFRVSLNTTDGTRQYHRKIVSGEFVHELAPPVLAWFRVRDYFVSVMPVLYEVNYCVRETLSDAVDLAIGYVKGDYRRYWDEDWQEEVQDPEMHYFELCENCPAGIGAGSLLDFILQVLDVVGDALDVHPGNILCGEDGQLYITDPVSWVHEQRG